VTQPPPPTLLCDPAITEALRYAVDAHRDLTRKDGSPFVLHVAETAALVAGTGADADVICAALLHDVLERSDTTADQLAERFGRRITLVVTALTQDPTITGYELRKGALRRQAVAAGPDARLVFAADKISKVRELRARWARRTKAPSAKMLRHRAHYQACLEMLASAPNLLVSQLDFELWALEIVASDTSAGGAQQR